MFLALLACRPSNDTVTVHVPAEHEAVFREYLSFVGFDGIEVEVGGKNGPGQDVILEVLPGEEAGWYKITADKRVTIEGGSVLGLQYGLSALLEEQGFRFVHPQHTVTPEHLSDLTETALDGVAVTPETPVNGLQLHTLHPIEALYDLWVPSDEGLVRAKQLIDWTIKNRGNHLQWPALDDISTAPSAAAPWQEHTSAIVEAAHARGMTIGLGVQLFGSGNLQKAFDLIDVEGYSEEEVDKRLSVIAPVGPDAINLSFGEFSGEEPETFVDLGNRSLERMRAAMPGIEPTTVIHVGNYEDLRVQYQGETLLYYFLAKHMDALPQVHTVMYYNLFEDAGGAYLHDEFTEHREFLLEGLRAGETLGYFPESAYWIAFDNPIPQYLPVYMRSRSTDLVRIREEAGRLPHHVLFSSGWEWGYWQTDMLTLRMAHGSADWEEQVRWLWSAWGEDGDVVADAVVALGDLQHQALIIDRLAAYLASREAIIDFGDSIGILSQPDRPQFDELSALSVSELAELDTTVAALGELSTATASILDTLGALDKGDRFIAEIADGIEIDSLRAAYIAAAYRASLASVRGEDSAAALSEMDGLLEQARIVVARRHGDLHWGGGDRITAQSDTNPSIYQFGYLAKADSLCFWERERAQVRNLALGLAESVPPCT